MGDSCLDCIMKYELNKNIFDENELDFLEKVIDLRDIHNQQNWDKECCRNEYFKIKDIKLKINQLKELI